MNKCLKIIFRKMIHCTSLAGAHFFTGETERILIGDENKSQIIMPQVFVKSIICGQIQQLFHFSVNIRDQFLAAVMAAVKTFENV